MRSRSLKSFQRRFELTRKAQKSVAPARRFVVGDGLSPAAVEEQKSAVVRGARVTPQLVGPKPLTKFEQGG
jgi:hypothetical protein